MTLAQDEATSLIYGMPRAAYELGAVTRRLPLAALADGAGVEKKTLERHRKYLMALLIIYSNGYEIIRGHLKQVLQLPKGGENA